MQSHYMVNHGLFCPVWSCSLCWDNAEQCHKLLSVAVYTVIQTFLYSFVFIIITEVSSFRNPQFSYLNIWCFSSPSSQRLVITWKSQFSLKKKGLAFVVENKSLKMCTECTQRVKNRKLITIPDLLFIRQSHYFKSIS